MTTYKHTDEFDALVAQTLKTQVAGKTPPRRVWRRIHTAVAGRSPRLPRWRWSMAAQVVVTVLVLFSGQLTLQTNRRQFVSPTRVYTPVAAVAVVHTESHTEAIVINPERQQMRALKSIQQSEVHTVATPPINLPPTDVVRPATEVALNNAPVAIISAVGLKPPMATGGVLR